jgi:ABC-2 type transport system ATP-binding protein
MRDLLRDHAARGGTVLLSSHLLHEIEVVADDIVMIGHGRIVSQGTKKELLRSAGTTVRATDTPLLRKALEAWGLSVSDGSDDALHADADPALVGQVAMHAGVALTDLRPAEGAGLEDMFLTLTSATQREGVPS